MQTEKNDWLQTKENLSQEIVELKETQMQMELKAREEEALKAELQERLEEREAEVKQYKCTGCDNS